MGIGFTPGVERKLFIATNSVLPIRGVVTGGVDRDTKRFGLHIYLRELLVERRGVNLQ